MKAQRRQMRSYGVVFGAVGFALLLMLLLNPWLAMTETPFLLFFGAVMVSAWYGGMKGGLLATGLSMLLSDYFFLSPIYAIALDPISLTRLSLFGLQSLAVSIFFETLQVAKHRLEVLSGNLKLSEERFRLALSSSDLAAFQQDRELKYLWIHNPQTHKFATEILGKTDYDLFPLSEADRITSIKKQVLETGIPTRQEVQLTFDGEVRYYDLMVEPFRQADGRITGIICAALNITQRKQAEKAIAISEAKFRRVVEANIFGVAIGDFSGKIIYANKALLKMLGYTREELTAGLIRWDEITPEEHLHLDKRGAEELRLYGVATPFEKEYIRKDGSRVPILIGGALLEEPYHRQQEIICFYLDLTEIKRNQALLATQNEVLEASATGKPLSEVLSLLVRSIEQQSNGGICSVFLASPDGKKLVDLIAPSLPETYKQPIKDGIPIGEGLGSCGTAAYRKETVIVSDIANDPLWAQWKDLPLTHGLQACWSTPILKNDGEVLGTFAMYYRTPREPSASDRQLVEISTHLAGIVISHQQAETDLKQSEERLRLALAAGRMGIWDWNIRTGEVKWSDNSEEIHGMEKGSFGGTFADFQKIVHPEDAEMVKNAIANAVANKSTYEVEFRIFWPDGSIHWIAGKGKTFTDETGQAVRMIGVGLDVTDRKSSEVALRRINERFELAASMVKCLVYEWDGQTGHLDRTQGMLDIIGYRPEEAEPTKEWWNSRIHPEDIPRARAAIAQCLAEGNTFTLEYRVRHRNGQYRYVWDRASVERNSTGEIIRIIGCSLDVTERKRTEEAQRYLSEASRVLSSSLDYQTTLQSVAQLTVPHLADWCTVHIVEEDGSVQQLATAHINPEKIKWAKEINRKYPYDPNAVRGVPNVLRTGNSELYPYIPDALLVEAAQDAEHLQILREVGFTSVIIVPLLAHGRTLGAISFIAAESSRLYDEADLALAEELAHRAALAVDNAKLYRSALENRAKAETANRIKDEFLATLSHELRTPLNGMLGWIQMLRSRQLSEGTTTKALDTVYRNAKSLSNIIEDLLDVSQIVTGKLRLNLYPVEVIPIVEAAIETVRSAAEAKEIQLHFHVNSGDLKFVLGDAERLQQVVWNLLSNAVKFTPKGGRVEVSCDRINSHIQIKVTDTGIGINPQFLPFVFDRFSQADSSTTRKYGGLGLGLAIVRHLVESQGGTVGVESLGEGQGATFIVTLPAIDCP